MDTLLIAALSFVGFIVAYHTYGRWLGRKIFKLDPKAEAPSVAMRDDVDYCPTRKEVVFGHHFTSIAGTGPIVGPAIAVFWGWLPALRAVAPGGVVVCAGIYMSDIPSFPYSILWEERVIKSVANLTRQDGLEFLELAPQIPVKTKVQVYPLEQANEALEDLRHGRLTGAAVLQIQS